MKFFEANEIVYMHATTNVKGTLLQLTLKSNIINKIRHLEYFNMTIFAIY
jgi:hypothetical protein